MRVNYSFKVVSSDVIAVGLLVKINKDILKIKLPAKSIVTIELQ